VQNGPKLLYFFRGEDSSRRPAFAAHLEARGWQIDCVAVSDDAPAHGVLEVLRCPRDLSSYDMLAASEYFLTWALCVRAIATQAKAKIVALSFNQSARLLLTGIRPIDRLLNRVWRRASTFLVHSNAEARLFAKVHDIPHERFIFSYWGYDLPAHDPGKVRLPAEPYVAMVGRNNRDLSTFREAVERAGVRGVLITSDYMLERFPVAPSDRVEILVDRPLDECLNYIAGSLAHLVLVRDSERGAGHISAVSAMLLGKPQIFSDVDAIADYLIDGFNGIAVPVGDADAVANAIGALAADPELARRLGSDGRRLALERMSDAASSKGLADALLAALP
jgi:glycosyltransferase involved in cell wall biosynthesis